MYNMIYVCTYSLEPYLIWLCKTKKKLIQHIFSTESNSDLCVRFQKRLGCGVQKSETANTMSLTAAIMAQKA